MRADGQKKKRRCVSGRDSGDREKASLYASYYAEIAMIEWITLRHTIHVIARDLCIPTAGLRRSQIAVACMVRMQETGQHPPEGYIPHWERASAIMLIKHHPRRTGRHSAHPGR